MYNYQNTLAFVTSSQSLIVLAWRSSFRIYAGRQRAFSIRDNYLFYPKFAYTCPVSPCSKRFLLKQKLDIHVNTHIKVLFPMMHEHPSMSIWFYSFHTQLNTNFHRIHTSTIDFNHYRSINRWSIRKSLTSAGRTAAAPNTTIKKTWKLIGI